MIKEILMVLGALFLAGLMLLLFTVNSTTGKGVRFIRLSDFWSGGICYAVFAVVFVIVVLPLYPIYVLLAVIWHKYHPPAVPVAPAPLPVEGDDPIWGRNVNRKRVEAAFLAVQQAWVKRDSASVQNAVGPDLYADLKQVCDRLKAHYEVNTRQDIHITEINIYDERIGGYKHYDGTPVITYYFNATICGTMTSFTTSEQDGRITAGSSESQQFEEKMQFSRGNGSTDPWCLQKSSGVPERVTHDSLQRKKHAPKTEPSKG